MEPTTHTTPNDPTAGARAAGVWTALGALLLMVALVLHPPLPAGMDAFMDLVAAEGATWRVAHWLAAAALAALFVGGLIGLSSPDLARSALTKSAWAVLSLGGLTTVITALAEATVIADAAAAGDTQTFAAWEPFAAAAALGFAFLGLAVAVIGGAEARRDGLTALPRWAAYVAVPAGIGAFTGWMLGPVLGFAFGGPLWLISSLVMGLWLAAFGVGVARWTTKVAHAEVTHA